MARLAQQSIRRSPGDRLWLAVIASAACAAMVLGVASAGRPSLAQGVVVSTDTVTTLRASAERSTVGSVVTLTANVEAMHVTAARGAVPGGFIDFYDETTARLLGRADPARPSITVSNLAPGAHEIRAYYRGTSDFLPAIMQPSMSQPVTLHVLAAPELALFVANAGGGAVDLTVSVKGFRGGAVPRGTIMFRDGETVLATSVQLDSSGQARFMTSALSAGSHVFVVEYSGDATYAAATVTIPKQVYDTTTDGLRPFSKAARD
jgi:hypothetical protein